MDGHKQIIMKIIILIVNDIDNDSDNNDDDDDDDNNHNDNIEEKKEKEHLYCYEYSQLHLSRLWMLLDWPLIPACQLDQQDVINLKISPFSLCLSLFPHALYSLILSAFISLCPNFPNIQMCTKYNSNFV